MVLHKLGALAIYKNYKKDKSQAIEDYKSALSLGYTKSIPEVYKAANIAFDFSSNNIEQLAGFMTDELNHLN